MLFTYLLFSAGISYSMHYCGDILTSTEMLGKSKGCICKTKDNTSHDCCKDVKIESAKDDQKTTSLYKLNFEKVVIEEIQFFLIAFINLYEEPSNTLTIEYNSPPPYKISKYIFNQIFRL
jgi:hypothetical protein